jgi:hypothetical protein
MTRGIVVLGLALALLGGFASSSDGSPASGPAKPILGITGNQSRFVGQTGQASTVVQAFIGWEQGTAWGSPFGALFATLGPIPMIHLGTSGKRTRLPAISVAQIASGQGDAYLGALNQAVFAWARPIYIRPLAEMNNPGNPWSGDPVAYRKAFARISVIVHGGAQAAARLAKLHLAPYRGPALAANPLPRVRVLWSPLAGGSDPKQYWPGAGYVDVGGADIYKEAGREPPWQKFASIYAFVRAQHRQFAVPEWGMFGVDDPSFVQDMCTFLKQHATETEEFYESKPGSLFDLANKPASRAAYRACVTRLAGPLPPWAG